MAQRYVTSAGTLIKPGAYASYTVQTANSGLSTTGVLMLVGEADAGPDYSLETDLSENAFGPDQLSDVVSKYKTGRLVDAFRHACAPANDPDITGTFSRCILVKTNPSTKAYHALLKYDSSAYGNLADKSYGQLGNLIYYTITADSSETKPSTGAFTYIPPVKTGTSKLYKNGGGSVTLSLTAAMTPTSFVSTVDGLSGIAATGGAQRTVLPGASGTLALAIVSGNSVTITYSGSFTTTPSAGDTLIITYSAPALFKDPSGGANNDNCGAYVVTTATSSIITATKLSDAGRPSETQPSACTAGAPSGGGAVNDGTHSYKVTFVTADGESEGSAKSNVITCGGGNNTVGLSAIPLGSAQCTSRNIYRTDAGDAGNWKLIGNIPDNTTTIYTDTSADGAGAACPTSNTTMSVVGVVTAPRATAAPVAVASANDIMVYEPVIITQEAADPIDGIGKTLEITEETGTDSLVNCCYNLGTVTAVSWISKTSTAYTLTSASEYTPSLNVNRQLDSVQENLIAGGRVALKLAYKNAAASAATVTISSTQLTTSITGASSDNLTLTLANYPTIADLVAYINAQTNYLAAVGTSALGQLAPTCLDRVTAQGILTGKGSYNGRIKVDAYDFFTTLEEESSLVQLGSTTAARADCGLPAPVATTTFLANGAKGATTNAKFSSAFTALESVQGNFLVPLISRDATSDIADSETDSSSTYTIAAVSAAAKTHVLAMSTLKRKRNRQALVGIEDTFANDQEFAANLASYRVFATFQDIKTLDSNADVVTYQPWMAAVNAAAMQAAGFYKAIVNKVLNVSGVVFANGTADFNDQNDTDIENALETGLCPIQKDELGSFRWVSDQNTYSKDDNFVYNSLQAVYAADTIALTSAQRMQRAFVGQSVADVSAAIVLTYLETIMADFMRLKLIAASSDAPRGFKNASVTISGPVIKVQAEVKLAGAIYFIPISFQISMVSQSA